jgi:cellulose biosynthesis protein BcsQ
MKEIAVYAIGKSTLTVNLSAALAERGLVLCEDLLNAIVSLSRTEVS